MRTRIIGLILAGLAVLATTSIAPAATQGFTCTDTAAVTSQPLLTAACVIDVTCPQSSECVVAFEGLGNGVGLIDARVWISGALKKSCRALLSCRPAGFTVLSGGDTAYVGLFVGGVPAGALTEARLTVRISQL